jgi:phospholipid/cholesterol/gamma-HCH transport system permease protein
VVLSLGGRLDTRSTGRLWRELEEQLRSSPVARLEVDAKGVNYCDGAGLALLRWLGMGRMTGPGATVTLAGLQPEFEALLGTFSAEDYERNRPGSPAKTRLAEEAGRGVAAVARDFQAQVAFVGSVLSGLAANLRSRRAMRWNEIWRVFEVAGANALPIVSLISLLVGLIIAFESAGPFKMFGAQIFIANMISIVIARELGPLMTAIILAGRSGSAFAAELGTMKVNEELNALETMGLDPLRFLIVQRVLAGALLGPLLTVYSIAVGIAGGALVMLSMGFSIETIYQQMAQTLDVGDFLVGTAKGAVFGLLVTAVGCLRGLQTGKGPSAVGEATTRAVVSGILLIILADAVFSVVLYVMDL